MLLAFSFLLSFVPRLLDHHWAERLPWHAHLAGGEEQSHRHPFETAHDEDRASFPDGATRAPGQVVVAFHDEGGGSTLAPALPLLSEEPTPAVPPFGRFSPAPGEEPRPAGTAPGVPHRPPIPLV